MGTYGVESLLPVTIVILLVFFTRKTTFSLVVGSVVGALLLAGPSFASVWIDGLYGVMRSDLWIWIVLVCGFFGSLVALFHRSGGIYGFHHLLERVCVGRRSTLLSAWLLGILIFIDDWLSILTVNAAMKSTMDRWRIPREMMAFLSCATASAACVIVPISTWGVFMTSQLISAQFCAAEEGMQAFLRVLPLLFYPFAVLLAGGLYAGGVLPLVGPLRRRQAAPVETQEAEKPPEGRACNLILPILLVTAVTVLTGEILYGTFAGLLFTGLLYLPQRVMRPGEYLETIVSGFRDMIGVFFIVTAAFLLRDLNARLGLPEYVIGLVHQVMIPELLPLCAFLLVAVLGFVAGNFWGICAISFPVILPIAAAVGAWPELTAAAIISATVASSNACFYGSEATLACAGAEIENHQYAKNAIPLLAPPFLISALLYLAAGLLHG